MIFFSKILRSLFAFIDSIFGWAVVKLYSLIVQIAHVDVFGNYIWEFMERIYAFLAIFMVFKLSISVVNYILNPDQLVDKAKGYGKLIQNVIIVIALIITVPMIFDWAYNLQSKILDTNVLYTIITGRKNNSSVIDAGMTADEKVEAIKNNADNAGQMLTYEILSTFIYRDDTASSEKDRSAKGADGNCFEKLGSNPSNYNYEAGNKCLTNGDTINDTSESTYDGFTNEYKFLISTICIGFTAYIFLVLAFDVALRTVRLGVLQLIAPIPIISRLDPNSGKNGMFSKWVKDCCNTYLSLFIRLIGLFFAIEIIKSMTESGRFVWYGTDTPVGLGFVKIFIMLGLLMFAKQLPDFIKSLTGADLKGDSLNLKKKVGSIPFAGKPMLAGAGLAGRTGAALGKMGGRYAGRMALGTGALLGKGVGKLDNKLGGYGHRTVGAVKGWGTGISGKAGSMWSNIANSKAGKWIGEQTVDARNTFAEIGTDFEKTALGTVGFDPMKKLNSQLSQIQSVEKQAGSILSRANGEMIKYNDLSIRQSDGSTFTMAQHKAEKEELNILQNRDTSGMDVSSSEFKEYTQRVSELRDRVNVNDKRFEQAYVTAVTDKQVLHNSAGEAVDIGNLNDKNADIQTINMVSGLKNSISRSNVDEVRSVNITDGKSIKAAKDKMGNARSSVEEKINNKQALSNPSKKS